jgi:hypothetical protein
VRPALHVCLRVAKVTRIMKFIITSSVYNPYLLHKPKNQPVIRLNNGISPLVLSVRLKSVIDLKTPYLSPWQALEIRYFYSKIL